MALDDLRNPVDEQWSGVLAVFNSTPWLVRQTLPLDLTGYELHPVQAEGADPLVRQSEVGRDWITVSARTAAVFVRPR
jgi:hypothetical protein